MTPVVWGYTFLEAPRADDHGGLYFSDIIAGGVYRWSPEGSVETVIPKRRGVGGLALHADGGLVVSGRDVCHVRNGQSRPASASAKRRVRQTIISLPPVVSCRRPTTADRPRACLNMFVSSLQYAAVLVSRTPAARAPGAPSRVESVARLPGEDAITAPKTNSGTTVRVRDEAVSRRTGVEIDPAATETHEPPPAVVTGGGSSRGDGTD